MTNIINLSNDITPVSNKSNADQLRSLRAKKRRLNQNYKRFKIMLDRAYARFIELCCTWELDFQIAKEITSITHAHSLGIEKEETAYILLIAARDFRRATKRIIRHLASASTSIELVSADIALLKDICS